MKENAWALETFVYRKLMSLEKSYILYLCSYIFRKSTTNHKY
jgi:hypothetical protein